MENEQNEKLDPGNGGGLKETQANPPHWYGVRHSQMILLSFLPFLAYGMRVNMSVGIVAMTDKKASPNPDIPTYEWNDQGVILSSFFMGYFIPQPAAGLLAKNYGPKWVIAVSFGLNSLLAIVIPFLASLGSWEVIVCRVFQGIAQGFLYPCIHQMLAKWVPPLERARLGTFVYSGANLGTVISMSFTGWLSGSWVGWPWAFYIYGAVGLLWTVVWIVFGKNSPAQHQTISPQERKYIELSLGETEGDVLNLTLLDDVKSKTPSQSPPTPWKAIFTSVPFWALLIVHSGTSWGFATLITNIPTYMSNVLDFDIRKNGALSAGPYLVFWIFSLTSAVISDFAISRNYVTTGFARKMANSIALCVPGVGLITLGIIGDAKWDITGVAVALLFIAVGFNGSSICGYHMNHMDLSPVHSGILMGLTNGIGNFFGVLAPLFLQVIVTDQSNPLQWSIIFYIASAIYIISNGVFVVFGSGEIQPWNNVGRDEGRS